jgi:hypothetical protein
VFLNLCWRLVGNMDFYSIRIIHLETCFFLVDMRYPVVHSLPVYPGKVRFRHWRDINRLDCKGTAFVGY